MSGRRDSESSQDSSNDDYDVELELIIDKLKQQSEWALEDCGELSNGKDDSWAKDYEYDEKPLWYKNEMSVGHEARDADAFGKGSEFGGYGADAVEQLEGECSTQNQMLYSPAKLPTSPYSAMLLSSSSSSSSSTPKPHFKYIVDFTVLQRALAPPPRPTQHGLSIMSGAYWDDAIDGAWSWQYAGGGETGRDFDAFLCIKWIEGM
ncbi:hypothetical protein BKA81DRAFT_411177 [Phyllosticta paracitricarpa]